VHSNYFRLGVWSLHSLSAIIELLDLELWYAFSRKRRNRTTVPRLITIAIHIHCADVKSSISTIRYALQVRGSSASIATMRRVLLTLPHDPISLGIHICATHFECVRNPCKYLVTCMKAHIDIRSEAGRPRNAWRGARSAPCRSFRVMAAMPKSR
jgi:hypothetical protein